MYKRVVAKVGTNVLSKDDGSIDADVVEHLAEQISLLKKKGVEVVLVTSGAVGVGRTRTHRRATVPGSAQRADKIDEFLSGFERDQGHWLLLSRSLLPLASLLGRSILAASLSVMRNRRAATLKESNLKNAQAERGSFIDSWILRFGHHL